MDIETSSFLDVAGLLRGEIRELSFDRELTPELDVEGITVTAPTRIKGKVVNLSGYMELDAELTFSYMTRCARCLTTIEKVMKERVLTPVAETLENMDNDEYIIPENGKIDLETLARETFFLNLPMAHFCRENCQGLCPKCGADRNTVDCGCVLKEKDPRWKALEGFFDEE